MSAQLSEHFYLREFLRSDYAARQGITLIPPQLVISNLQRLCNEVLEPVRAQLGRPIFILSGWRPQWLNTAVGGSKQSAHIDGRAADIEAASMSNAALAGFMAKLKLPTDKIILEFPPNGWVHAGIAVAGFEPRREVLTAQKFAGETRYTEGIA